jgi:hypothetical protein
VLFDTLTEVVLRYTQLKLQAVHVAHQEDWVRGSDRAEYSTSGWRRGRVGRATGGVNEGTEREGLLRGAVKECCGRAVEEVYKEL